MSEPAVKFSQSTARQIQRAVQGYLSDPVNQTGNAVKRHVRSNLGFWAKITGNSTTPYHYSWQEQYDTESGFTDRPTAEGGRSGTTTTNYAINGFDSSSLWSGAPPIATGTSVWITLTFDDQSPSNPVWRFNQYPLPNWWPEVDLVSDGGANATPVYEGWTPATYTYSVYVSTFSGDSTKLLLTSATPRRGRPAGWLAGPASRGTVCLLPDGTLALASADEQLNIFSPCAESDGD